MNPVFVKTPATSANLGPGFDCLGVALDLWNYAEFKIGGEGLQISIHGEGAGILPENEENMIVQSALYLYQFLGETFPENLKIICENHIPLGSGLGSSSAAILSGLLGANILLGQPLSRDQILKLGVELEGHPDNIAPALFEGFVISSMSNGEAITRQVDVPSWHVTIVLPDIELSTHDARNVLPENVSLSDAVKNIGNTALLIEAMKNKDIDLLRVAMKDELHQPYRLPLIRGAQELINAANQAGGAAALSGAGPSVVVFSLEKQAEMLSILKTVLENEGVPIRRTFQLSTLN